MIPALFRDLKRYLWSTIVVGGLAVVATVVKWSGYLDGVPTWAIAWTFSLGVILTLLLAWRRMYLDLESATALSEHERQRIQEVIATAGMCNEYIGGYRSPGAPPWQNAVSQLTTLTTAAGELGEWSEMRQAIRDFEHQAQIVVHGRTNPAESLMDEDSRGNLEAAYREIVRVGRHLIRHGRIAPEP